jgi:hypothetical protein
MVNSLGLPTKMTVCCIIREYLTGSHRGGGGRRWRIKPGVPFSCAGKRVIPPTEEEYRFRHRRGSG